ncbi:MAG: hypothetical protein ACTS85_03835 [Arsenophonus sp. NC-PG7-MAG3]
MPKAVWKNSGEVSPIFALKNRAVLWCGRHARKTLRTPESQVKIDSLLADIRQLL